MNMNNVVSILPIANSVTAVRDAIERIARAELATWIGNDGAELAAYVVAAWAGTYAEAMLAARASFPPCEERDRLALASFRATISATDARGEAFPEEVVAAHAYGVADLEIRGRALWGAYWTARGVGAPNVVAAAG